MSGIYNIGLFVMAFPTGSSGQVLVFFAIHTMITVRANTILMSCDHLDRNILTLKSDNLS